MVQQEGSFELLIDKALLEQVGGVKIEFSMNRFMGSGFTIYPSRATPGGGCSC